MTLPEDNILARVGSAHASQARGQLSTQQLMRAASELIAQHGYERTTLAAIGKHAGYSHGIVSRRFGTKDGLLLALMQVMLGEFYEHEIAPVAASLNGIEEICLVLTKIRHRVQADPAGMRAMYTLMLEAPTGLSELLRTRLQDLHADQFNQLQRAIIRGIETGAIRPDVNPADVAHLVMSVHRGAMYQWLLDDAFDFEGTLAALERLVPEWLGADSWRAGRDSPQRRRGNSARDRT
jgi:AcrR family transcriptional regulator